jgi:hypothetical protein
MFILKPEEEDKKNLIKKKGGRKKHRFGTAYMYLT